MTDLIQNAVNYFNQSQRGYTAKTDGLSLSLTLDDDPSWKCEIKFKEIGLLTDYLYGLRNRHISLFELPKITWTSLINPKMLSGVETASIDIQYRSPDIFQTSATFQKAVLSVQQQNGQSVLEALVRTVEVAKEFGGRPEITDLTPTHEVKSIFMTPQLTAEGITRGRESQLIPIETALTCKSTACANGSRLPIISFFKVKTDPDKTVTERIVSLITEVKTLFDESLETLAEELAAAEQRKKKADRAARAARMHSWRGRSIAR